MLPEDPVVALLLAEPPFERPLNAYSLIAPPDVPLVFMFQLLLSEPPTARLTLPAVP